MCRKGRRNRVHRRLRCQGGQDRHSGIFTGDVGVGGKPLIHLEDHVRVAPFLRQDGAAALGMPKAGWFTSQAILK